MLILNKLIRNFIKCGNKQKVEKKLYNILFDFKGDNIYSSELLLDKVLNKLMVPFVLQQTMNKRNKKKYPVYVRFKKNIRLTLKSFSNSVLLHFSIYKLEKKFFKELVNVAIDRSFSQQKNESFISYFLEERALFSRRNFLRKRRRIKFF